MFTVLFLLVPRSVGAQAVSRGTDGTVSVNASGAPLVQVLEKLVEIYRVERLIVSPAIARRIVTVTIENVTALQAIKDVLAAADVDYVLSSRRLVVGESRFIDMAGPANAVSSERNFARLEKMEEHAESAADHILESESEAQRRQAELMQALSPRAAGIVPRAIIEVPFPAADGVTPLTQMRGPRPPWAAPFAIDGAPAQPRADPPLSDPRLIELMKALSPTRGPGSR